MNEVIPLRGMTGKAGRHSHRQRMTTIMPTLQREIDIVLSRHRCWRLWLGIILHSPCFAKKVIFEVHREEILYVA